MKHTNKIILNTFALLFAFQLSFATVRTVSNDVRGGSQYNTLQAAYDAAINGDTIVLEGTDLVYSMADAWDKSLIVIGAGYNPQKQNVKTSKIYLSTNYGSYFVIASGGSGSRFYGIVFAHQVYNYGMTVNNLQFINCMFTSVLLMHNYCSNLVFKNCLFQNNLEFNTSINTFVSNCIFSASLYCGGSLGLTIDHSLFLTSNNYFTLSNLNSGIIANSIFMNADQFNDITNTTFSNNIFRIATALPSGTGNGGAGNLFSTDPNFVNYTLGDTYHPSHDYHVPVSSAAHLAAGDSTDIGPHGGFTKFNESGEPLIAPVMRLMNVSQAITSPSSTINVQIHASKPNDN